jgi:hypothetical protein
MNPKLLVISAFLLILGNETYSQWKIYISNDVCIDYTWCLTEDKMKLYMAELIAAHLDVMKSTDNEAWFNKDRYTCTTTTEILFFLEKYPERKEELLSRINEGRIILSPFLVNTMWGFAGSEGFLRAMYPAKRFAVENHITIQHAVHSELPSMPWDIVPLLAGSGIRWINKPFLNYDATFGSLENPPLFRWRGPDGSIINALLDKTASLKYSYMQGGGVLKIPPFEKDTSTIESFWIPSYKDRDDYPLKTILAEGTHCDLSPNSASQSKMVALKIINYNKNADRKVKMINSTFKMFADVIDSVDNSSPFMKVITGSYGHSWELWPLDLVKYAVGLRKGEADLLTAESLLSSSGISLDDIGILKLHRKAEWLLALLQDHAWNGCDPDNIQINSDIRKRFSEELLSATDSLISIGFKRNGFKAAFNNYTVFNPSAFSRDGIIEIPCDTKMNDIDILSGKEHIESQYVIRNGVKSLCFLTGLIPPFGFRTYSIVEKATVKSRITGHSPYFSIKINSGNEIEIRECITDKLISCLSLVHTSSMGLSAPVCASFKSLEKISSGTLGEIYRVEGIMPFTKAVIEIINPESHDELRFTVSIEKEINTSQEGLYLRFKLPCKIALEAETTAAVTIPYMIPKGDLLPGADTTRMAIQGFVIANYPEKGGIVCASPDAFCLIPSRNSIIIQLLGNNHNYREAVKNQNDETNFQFRFAVREYRNKLDISDTYRFGKSMQMPLVLKYGKLKKSINLPGLSISNAIVTCRKPADPSFGKGEIIRFYNPESDNREINITCPGYTKAVATDLLEQDMAALKIENDVVRLPVKAKGFASIRLEK